MAECWSDDIRWQKRILLKKSRLVECCSERIVLGANHRIGSGALNGLSRIEWVGKSRAGIEWEAVRSCGP